MKYIAHGATRVSFAFYAAFSSICSVVTAFQSIYDNTSMNRVIQKDIIQSNDDASLLIWLIRYMTYFFL